ncbi:MAG: hypothetical protein ABSG18_05575 [Steroidobacteraceae bacterium]|jgi:hypothetical protein
MSALAPVRRLHAIAGTIKDSIAALDAAALSHSLDREGFAMTPGSS